MKTSFFIGKKVHLRAMEPEDLDWMYSIENDPELWDVSNFSVPYSKYVLKEYIANSQYDIFADKQLRMIVVRNEDDKVVGTIDITDFAPLHRRGEVGIGILREHQGNGYGKEALELLCRYLFDFLRMHQLTAHIAVDNERSLHLFKSCGFVECGLLKEWWSVKGSFKDVVLLQCFPPKNKG